MKIELAVATVIGAAIFPFLINTLWGRLVEKFGTFGWWMAAGFIVGTTWTLNHYMGLITQSGDAWIDMGTAAAFGGLSFSTLSGGKLSKAVPNILAALVGGLFGGLIMSLFLPK